jgi:MYXO-CTERM domain-containing protein
MKRTLIASCFSLALFGCGSGVVPGDGSSVSERHQQIQGGDFDTEHENVVGMVLQTNQGIAMCSGNLIAPNLVLTARHCVSSLSPDTGYVECGVTQFLSPHAAQNMFFSTEAQLSQNSNWVQGSEVHVPSEGTDVCGYDVALVTLSENLTTAPLVPRIDLEPQTGEPYTAVGFGEQGNSGWGGSRMELGNLSVVCGTSECASSYQIASSEFEGDTGVCQGDSGGPALDASGKVIGVVSRGGAGCTIPIYGAVSSWKDFITGVALDAAQKGGYPPPFWALSGSSDPGGTGGSAGATGTGGEPATGGSGGGGSPQGQACGTDQACPSGFKCLGTGTTGNCAAACDAQSPCGDGTTCDPAVNACVANQANPNGNAQSSDTGGCTVVGGQSGRGPVKPVPWLVGAVAFALGFTRRRRR